VLAAVYEILALISSQKALAAMAFTDQGRHLGIRPPIEIFPKTRLFAIDHFHRVEQ
jgi:hypothetical protein